MLDNDEKLKTYYAIAKSMTDESYNSFLRSRPHEALKEVGLHIADIIKIFIHDKEEDFIETENELHLCIPNLEKLTFTDTEFGRAKNSKETITAHDSYNCSDCVVSCQMC